MLGRHPRRCRIHVDDFLDVSRAGRIRCRHLFARREHAHAPSRGWAAPGSLLGSDEPGRATAPLGGVQWSIDERDWVLDDVGEDALQR